MSGIYIHVPFCVSRCAYCDFYSSTLKDRSFQYVKALAQEMRDRKDYLPADEPIRTLYIGGGTPSQLSIPDLRDMYSDLASNFDLSNVEEVTLEVNPEDITEEYVRGICEHTPINRISMGVQSFVDSELKLLRRRHNSAKPKEVVDMFVKAGITNISIDLIYGLPQQSLETWLYTIQQALALPIKHISAYCLSVEPGTLMEKMVQSGKYNVPDDETCNSMAGLLRDALAGAGFDQYEISNYAKPGYHSRHNSSYWNGTAYLGLGPGAHSFDGRCTRGYNLPDLEAYLAGNRSYESEELAIEDQYNEFIMLLLRTPKGIYLSDIERKFASSPEILQYFKVQLPKIVESGLLKNDDGRIALTSEGLNLADEVIRDLFYVSE